MNRHGYFWTRGRLTSRGVHLALAAVLLAGLGGGSTACSPSESSKTLAERVERYWELKQARRWDEIYDAYLDPTQREEIARDVFLEKRKLAFEILNYTVTEAKEEGEEATVAVTNEAHIPVPAGEGEMQMIRRTVQTKDQWVRREGVWYVTLPG